MNTKIHEKISILEECKIKLKIKRKIKENKTKINGTYNQKACEDQNWKSNC